MGAGVHLCLNSSRTNVCDTERIVGSGMIINLCLGCDKPSVDV